MLTQTQDERSVGQLFGELTREFGALVRDEVTLAKTEIIQNTVKTGQNVAFMAAGGLLAFAGLLKLLDAVIAGLVAAGMAQWAAALLVGLVVMAVAAGLVMKGLNALKGQDMAPRQTIETLKEDAKWAQQQAK